MKKDIARNCLKHSFKQFPVDVSSYQNRFFVSFVFYKQSQFSFYDQPLKKAVNISVDQCCIFKLNVKCSVI